MAQIKSYNKIIAFLVVMLIVLVMLFSCVYVVEHVDHECTGEDCPVCALICQYLDNIKQIICIAVASICFFALSITGLCIKENYINRAFVNSLISQKVRMND